MLDCSARNTQRKQVIPQLFHLCWRTGCISIESDLNKEKMRNRSQIANYKNVLKDVQAHYVRFFKKRKKRGKNRVEQILR